MRSLLLLSFCAPCFAAHAPKLFHAPLSFEPNAGQAPHGVRFLSRAAGLDVFLRDTEVMFSRRGHQPVTVKFLGAESPAGVDLLDKLPGVSHYYVGPDPAKWREFVPNYARIRMKEIYPGIDAVFYGKGNRLEYDFVVAPGADPSVIAIGSEGADSMKLDAAGDLILTAGTWTLRQHKPKVYQVVAGRQVEVEASYALGKRNRATIALAAYDPSLPLVVDPVIGWLTLLGGNDQDSAGAITVDPSGNVIVAGSTRSTDFPTTPDALDRVTVGAFITKFNPSGSAVVYSTFFGPSETSLWALASDGAGSIYCMGATSSAQFPTTPGAFQRTYGGLTDTYVAKLSTAGTLAYSTFLGGSGTDLGRAIVVDSSGSAILTGSTGSGNFPVLNAAQPTKGAVEDAFIVKLNPAGSALVLSTFLGGSGGDFGYGLGIDGNGNYYIGGWTSSRDLPVRNAIQSQFGGAGSDGFVAKLNANGSAFSYVTYLGSATDESVSGLVVTVGGEAIVAGASLGSLGVVPGSFGYGSYRFGSNISVVKINAAGTALSYGALLGGNGNESVSSLALSPSGEVTIAGTSDSVDYPTKAAFQLRPRGGRDIVITRLNATGADLVYSTYLGGNHDDLPGGVAIDGAGNAYLAGYTLSTDLPVTTGAYDTAPSPNGDAFVAKIAPGPTPIAVTIASSPVPGAPVLIDGAWYTTPTTQYWLPGTTHDIGVDPVTMIGSTAYSFNSWSPGTNNRLQTVPTPVADATFTINYNAHPTCTYRLESQQLFVPPTGEVRVQVTTQPGCPWMIRPLVPWISIESAEAFFGSGPAIFTVHPPFGGPTFQNIAIAFQIAAVIPVSPIEITAPSPGQTIGVGGVTFGWSGPGSSFDMNIRQGSRTVFQGRLEGSQSTSTIVTLEDGDYTFSIRSCFIGSAGPGCAMFFSSVPFRVTKARPSQSPSITNPASNATLTTSTNTLRWTAVPSAQYYEVELDNAATGAPELRISQPATDTTFSMHSGPYKMRVRACQSACGPWSIEANFAVALAPVPTAAPANVACQAVTTNQLSCTWNAVPNADLYVLQVVQSNTGPGGGALTVASYRGEATGVTNLPVPMHPANQAMFVIVAGCNGNGCGPNSVDSTANGTRQVVLGPNPAAPFLGTPIPGTIVAGPVVQFSWNRIASDTGANTYRLFTLDFSRQSTALDILTKQNFYAAYFRAEGTRYDALVFAAPPNGNPGGAAPFNVSGTNSAAPTMAIPRHQDTGVTDTLPFGNMLLGWTPVPGATLYEYYVGLSGSQTASARGVTPRLSVQVPLSFSGVYDGIVRACPAGATCTSGSDAGWGPWSNLAGPGVTKFRVQ